MSRSDETYLEAFIESLSTLPHQVRRNLELMKDLDKSCSEGTDKMRRMQQEFILRAEEKMMKVDMVVSTTSTPTTTADDGTTTSYHEEQQQQRVAKKPKLEEEDDAENNNNSSLWRIGGNTHCGDSSPPVVGVRVMNGDAVVVPTTEEWMAYVFGNNDDDAARESYQRIQQLQRQCLQQADEKVAIAVQTYEIVDSTVQRLDRDLQNMEKLLQSTGEFHSGSAAKPNDLAACQVTPGSEWILAKVIHHDPATGMYKLSDEDVESKNKIFHLPESQVVVLSHGKVEKLVKGDIIYAVYPDTTSFYQATVAQGPRKATAANAAAATAAGLVVAAGTGGSTTAAAAAPSFVMVHFLDDSDEYGITHDKAVPLKHVMLPPYGATIVHG